MKHPQAYFHSFLWSLLFFGFGFGEYAHAFLDPARDNITQYTAKRLIVKYKADVEDTTAMASTVMNGVSERMRVGIGHSRWLATGAQLVDVGAGTADESLDMASIMDEIMASGEVEYVEQDRLFKPMLTPNDEFYAEQWHYFDSLSSIRVDLAWDLAYPDGFDAASRLQEVVVAVLDTGVVAHADLQGKTLPGYDFIADPFVGNDGNGRDSDAQDPGDYNAAGACGNNSPAADSSWHGTHVAGTIAAVTHNGFGVAGVAPNAKILPVRVLGRCGGVLSDIVDAILWSVGLPVGGTPLNPNPAQVLNLSLGAPGVCSNAMNEAINRARDEGALMVVAAGNEQTNAANVTPASCANAFTVAAVGRAGSRAFYSNFGNNVDVAAPGGNGLNRNPPDTAVLSTVNSGSQGPEADALASYIGTSMAAPHVAGVAALVFGANPGMTAIQAANVIRGTVRAFPVACEGCGAGIVDAMNALTEVLPPAVEAPPAVEQPPALVEEPVNSNLLADVSIRISTPSASVNFASLQNAQTRNARAFLDQLRQVYTYTITVDNLSSNPAAGVRLENELPSGVLVTSIQGGQGTCDVNGLWCDVGVIPALGEATVDIKVEISPFKKIALGQAASVKSTIKSMNPDLNQSNNEAFQPLAACLNLVVLLLVGVMGVVRRLNF